MCELDIFYINEKSEAVTYGQQFRIFSFGGADCPKDELDGRVINLSLSMDCGTNWVRQPATGGDGESRASAAATPCILMTRRPKF